MKMFKMALLALLLVNFVGAPMLASNAMAKADVTAPPKRPKPNNVQFSNSAPQIANQNNANNGASRGNGNSGNFISQ